MENQGRNIQGISPATPKPLSEERRIIKPKAPPSTARIEEKKHKPLPKRTISLKMTNIEVSVVLRALARAADQNIIVSEQVSGKININIAQAPGTRCFSAFCVRMALVMPGRCEIIRIMTSDDMEEGPQAPGPPAGDEISRTAPDPDRTG